MAIKITIEGDDKEELLTAAQALVELLGGEDEDDAPADDDDDAPADDDDAPVEDEEPEEDDEAAKLRARIKKLVTGMIKKPGGVDKIRKAFALGKGKKLDQIKDQYLTKVLAALKK